MTRESPKTVHFGNVLQKYQFWQIFTDFLFRKLYYFYEEPDYSIQGALGITRSV